MSCLLTEAILLFSIAIYAIHAASFGSQACLQDVSFTITPVDTAPTPMCAGTKMEWFGEQTYYKEALPKKQIHIWKEQSSQNDQTYAFLAWERLYLPNSEQNINGTSWSERTIHAIDSASKTEQKVPQLATAQKPFEHHNKYEVMQMEATYAIIRMNSLQDLLILSLHLQRDTRITQLTAIPRVDTLNVNVTLPKPKFNPPLHALLFSDTLDVPQLREDARILSGEDEAGQWIPSGSLDDSLLSSPSNHWHSRHSATQEARLAGAWIRARLSRYLAPLDGRCIEWNYDDSFAPNIVCTIPVANSKKKNEQEGVAILSAHYDSRGTFGSTRAPGADDDGSGTTMLLAVARHLGKHRIEFNREIRLVAFSGEEQGLVGSKNYAKHLREKNTPVHFQLQADMLGYRKPGEPLQVAFPDKLATQAATDYVIDLARLYVPELQIGYTPACCSDHQSFWEQGFTSTWVFERRGPIADPCYHDSCDLTDRKGYDFEQIQSITKLCLATLLDIGGGVDWPY
ncbi:hypothetical protein L7F22_044196 [Adiantum nelumboides]|nr:hypothetical protein [Adiantum nelumboides]